MSHGPGGNTSIKIGQSIYVKSSGTWFKDSLKKNSFIKIDLNSIKKNIKNEKKWKFNNSKNSPSIETIMHAIIKKKYVVHLHSISVLSYAVLKEGKKVLENKLKNDKWVWINYKKPGLNLALEIKKKESDNANIYILQNHGIIIASDTLFEINLLLKKIEKKLKRKGPYNLKKIKKNNFSIKNYKKPKDNIINMLACNKSNYEIMKKNKSLYPDHIVFLNKKILAFDNLVKKDLNKENNNKIIVVRNIGVFIKNNITKTEYDMLLCLAELLNILPNNSTLSFLNKKEERQLLYWDKEKIRQKFNKV